MFNKMGEIKLFANFQYTLFRMTLFNGFSIRLIYLKDVTFIQTFTRQVREKCGCHRLFFSVIIIVCMLSTCASDSAGKYLKLLFTQVFNFTKVNEQQKEKKMIAFLSFF